MKKQTTTFLKLALLLIVIPILGFFIIVLPGVTTGLTRVFPVSPLVQYFGFIGLYGAVTPFLVALYLTLKLLINIKKDKAFSESSLMALKNIKYCARTISVLYVIGMPLLFLMGDADDAPGVVLFGLIVILAAIMSAFFAAVFEKRCHRNKIS
jgi:hypothetical protein